MYLKIKRKIFEELEASAGDSFAKKILDYFIISVILLNTIIYVVETVDEIAIKYSVFLKWFEIISIFIFTTEYILRLWTCNLIPKYKGQIIGRIKYIFSPFALIDLLAFLPFYLTSFTRINLTFIRVLRLFRFVRLFKLGRYSDAITVLGRVFKSKKEELILTLTVAFILIVVSSSFIYIAEHEAQPDKFKNIPESMYWAVTTLTSVGYGDICPITPVGKFLTSIIAIIGLGMIALPTGILASGFNKEISKEKKYCPHCGEKL